MTIDEQIEVIRNYINTNLVQNGVKGISAIQVNVPLNEILNILPLLTGATPPPNVAGDLIDGATTEWDFSDFNIAKWTIEGSNELVIEHPVANKGGLIYLTQDEVGGRVPVLPGKKPVGMQFSSNPGGLDVLGFFYDGVDFVWSIANYGTVSSNPTLATPVLTATPASSTQINLSVAAVTNATSYKFERATNSTFTSGVTTLQNTSATTFNDTGRTASTQYWYRVTAQAAGYNDGASSIVSATTPATNALGTPLLTTTPVGTTQINLSTTTVINATSYKFERATNSAFTTGVTILQNTSATTYNDTGLTTVTTYYYRVTAQAAGFTDGVSSIVPATTNGALTTPTLTVSNIDSTTLGLSSSTVSGATGYKFERATNSAFTTGVTTLQDTSATSFNDTGLTTGTTYYYRVTAHAPGYLDAVSSIISGTPATPSAQDIVWGQFQNSSSPVTGNVTTNGSVPSGATATKKLAKANGNYVQLTVASTGSDGVAMVLTTSDDANYVWNSSANLVLAGFYTYGGTNSFFSIDTTASNGSNQGSIAAGGILRLEVSGNDILYRKSTDGGTSFTTLGTITNALSGVSSATIKFIGAVNSVSNLQSSKGLGLV